MPSYLRPALLPLCCGAAVLGVGLSLPVWHRDKRVGECIVEAERVPVWRGLTERRPAPGTEFVDSGLARDDNRANCLALLAAAGAAGAGVFWVRRPRSVPAEAGDYSDGPGGSVRDSRSTA